MLGKHVLMANWACFNGVKNIAQILQLAAKSVHLTAILFLLFTAPEQRGDDRKVRLWKASTLQLYSLTYWLQLPSLKIKTLNTKRGRRRRRRTKDLFLETPWKVLEFDMTVAVGTLGCRLRVFSAQLFLCHPKTQAADGWYRLVQYRLIINSVLCCCGVAGLLGEWPLFFI